MKEYLVYFISKCSGYCMVNAENEEEAEAKALQGEYEDVIENYIEEIEKITGVEAS